MKTQILIFFLLISFGVKSQTIELGESDSLSIKTIYYDNNDSHLREVEYRYTNGKLYRIATYHNTELSSYTDIEFNKLGNEERRTFYTSSGEIQHILHSIYDSENRLLSKEKTDENDEFEYIYEYDTLSRIIAKKKIESPKNSNETVLNYKYEYPRQNLVKKLDYRSGDLSSYTLIYYNNRKKKVREENYNHNGEIQNRWVSPCLRWPD